MPSSSKQVPTSILVLGAGNFGTCLAQHLADLGRKVTIWSHLPEIAAGINSLRRNPRYLSTITLSDRITATTILTQELFDSHQVVVQVTPSQTMREVFLKVKPFWRKNLLLVCAAKGIEIGTLKLPTEVIGETLGSEIAERSVILSGPSFASEVVIHQPTAVTAASHSEESAALAQWVFHAPFFRVYTSRDPVGLEIAGALKNVIAIATGACRGLGFMDNARAAIITRGLAEMTRLGVALGANPMTFKGLGGVGDLFMTCTSEKSRNFTVGLRMGQGYKLEEVLDEVGVAEGVYTAKAAYELARKVHVETPIIDQVYRVLYEGAEVADAVKNLTEREAKWEY
jgi:glycerol-3-phosphate dehydrogenase (NAD(P)+)